MYKLRGIGINLFYIIAAIVISSPAWLFLAVIIKAVWEVNN